VPADIGRGTAPRRVVGGSYVLVSVIQLAAEDLEAAVELLEDEDADEAVGDGEAAEGDEGAGAVAEGVAVAVGAADGEDDRGAAAVLLLVAQDAVGEGGAGEVSPRSSKA
jgi:hypothetical protein